MNKNDSFLEAQKRIAAKKASRRLKKINKIPAILYGHKTKNQIIEVPRADFKKIFKKSGTTTLIDLKIEKDKELRKVLIHQVQYHPVTLEPIHIDFYQIKMTEKIKTEVPIKTKGKAPAVEELGGNLIITKPAIEIECLPQDLIHEIKIDLTGLKTFENKITIADLNLPKTISILDNPEEAVVVVTPPRTEEELEELEETPVEQPGEVEVISEKKEEGEEGEIEDEGGKKEKPAPAQESSAEEKKST